jgi:hypothetical protein
MDILDRFLPKVALNVEVTVDGLPPHWALAVHALSLRVGSAGVRPVVDPHRYESECVKEAEAAEAWPLRFVLRRRPGFYYIGLSVIAFRNEAGKTYAQVERFFPMPSPCRVDRKSEVPIVLNVRWPDIPLSELGSYGTVHSGDRSN